MGNHLTTCAFGKMAALRRGTAKAGTTAITIACTRSRAFHSCGNGTRYEQEEDARGAVDESMDGYELSRGLLVQEDSSQGRGR